MLPAEHGLLAQTFSRLLLLTSQEEDLDSEHEKLVVREPEDEDGECQPSQHPAGRVWPGLRR